MSKTLGFVAALLISAGPALAQQAAPPQAAPPSSTTSGPSLQLSMEQAVTMAMETNLGLKVDRLDVNIAAENIRGAKSAYRPVLQSSFSRNTVDRQSSSSLEGGSDIITSGNQSFRSSIQQNLPWYGGNYSAVWTAGRNTTSDLFSRFNPQVGSSFGFGVTQPLLRNFRIDSLRASVQNAESARQIADLSLERQITTTSISVRQAYLSLIGAIRGLEVAQQNMRLAQENLRNFRARVNVGVAADIEIIQAETQVANNEEQVVVNEAQIDTAMDALRALIFDPRRPDFWQVRLEPTDTIQALPIAIDVEGAVQRALTSRLDLLSLRRQQEVMALNLRVSENQVKPDLNFSVNYSAQGTGGTQLAFGEGGFPPQIIGRTDRAFSSAVGDAFRGTFPNWTIGAQFSYPIGNVGAKAALARTRIEKQQQDLTLQNLELQIATQVRQAARNVQSNLKRFEATRRAREATELQLDAEQRKFDVGLSSSFELQSRQRDLAAVRVSELNATIAYNRALIDLERVQKVQ